MTDIFDYVIVGAGSAGSVLAGRLGEDEKTTVCVLEAGPPDRSMFIHIPGGFMKTILDPKVNWLYQSESSEGTAGRRIAAPRGKTLGGSSSINGNVYNRGQRMDYDAWGQLGNRGWGYADVLPYFKRSERRIGEGDDTYRGRDGNLVITDIDWHHPLCERFIAGAVGLGIPRNPDYNGAVQDGVSYAQRTIHKRRRVSSAKAFLHPAMARPNLEVRTEVLASRILFEGKRAVGIQYLKGGQEFEVAARREVILSGGTVNSPQLLQISGVGPGGLLREIGVPVHHELPGVGENLRDHYAARMTARVKNIGTINEKSRGFRLGGEIAKYFLGMPSILGLSPTLVYLFWKSDPARDTGDIQLTFTPASYKEGVQSRLDDFPGMTVASWQQRPDSLGYIRARSADPREQPAIQPNYLAEETDRRVMLAAIKLGRALFGTPDLAPYLDRVVAPTDDVQSDDELLAFARERGTTCFHLMGSCRMGPGSDPLAVVDDQLRVRGLEGLRLVDASIMPTMPSSNTNAPAIMIGEKAADLIAGKSPLPAAELGGAPNT